MGRDSSDVAQQSVYLDCSVDPDITGEVVGAGTAGKTYRWIKLVEFTHGGGIVSADLHVYGQYGASFGVADKVIQINRALVRPATPTDILATDLEATVAVNAAAIASVEGAAAYYNILVAAGAEPAVVELNAGSAGSRVDIAANAIKLRNISNGVIYDALTVADGDVLVHGKLSANMVDTNALAANAVTAAKINVSQLDALSATIGVLRTASSGARMEIRDNVIKVFDSSNNLRVKLGNLSL